jgi:hypothetical protein
LLRPARRIAAAFALISAATPALAGQATSGAATAAEKAPEQTGREPHRTLRVPEPRAPQRQPLQARRNPFEEPGPGVRFDERAPPDDFGFEGRGLRFDSGGLAYTIKF